MIRFIPFIAVLIILFASWGSVNAASQSASLPAPTYNVTINHGPLYVLSHEAQSAINVRYGSGTDFQRISAAYAILKANPAPNITTTNCLKTTYALVYTWGLTRVLRNELVDLVVSTALFNIDTQYERSYEYYMQRVAATYNNSGAYC